MYSEQLKADLDKDRPHDIAIPLATLEQIVQRAGLKLFLGSEQNNPAKKLNPGEVAVVAFEAGDQYSYAIFSLANLCFHWQEEWVDKRFVYRPMINYVSINRSAGGKVDVVRSLLIVSGLEMELPFIPVNGQKIVAMPIPSWVDAVASTLCYQSEAQRMMLGFADMLLTLSGVKATYEKIDK